MKIFNLYQEGEKVLIIKHETAIDPDDTVCHDNSTDEMVDFHYYLKNLIGNEALGVQVFEYVKRNTSLSDYACPNVEWEDRNVVKKWRKEFKDNHQLYLYFYHPKGRMESIYTGYVDTQINMRYSDKNSSKECFEINDYVPYELPQTTTFQIEIYSPLVYQCLEKSNIEECKDILRVFQNAQLKKRLDADLSQDNIGARGPKI